MYKVLKLPCQHGAVEIKEGLNDCLVICPHCLKRWVLFYPQKYTSSKIVEVDKEDE